jgi:RNA polymerase sigma factor (sigma-70 family)
MKPPPTTYPKNSEQQNWIAFQKGDEKAYANLYTTYFVHLFRYGKKFTQDTEMIEDCIQDLYVSLWKSRENLGVPESVKNYLFKSLRFSIFKKLKINDNMSFEEVSPEEYSHEVTVSQEVLMINETEEIEQKRKIEKAMATLPKRQREAIFLKFYGESSYQEIADIMQISVQAVYNLISKSLVQFQRELILSLMVILNF